MRADVHTFNVTFLPEQKTIEITEGATLSEAAEKAGVYVNSVCGGEGTCGECRLQIMQGKARRDKNSIGFFSTEEFKNAAFGN